MLAPKMDHSKRPLHRYSATSVTKPWEIVIRPVTRPLHFLSGDVLDALLNFAVEETPLQSVVDNKKMSDQIAAELLDLSSKQVSKIIANGVGAESVKAVVLQLPDGSDTHLPVGNGITLAIWRTYSAQEMKAVSLHFGYSSISQLEEEYFYTASYIVDSEHENR